MTSSVHYVSGFFAHIDQVEDTINKLRGLGVPAQHIHWLQDPEKTGVRVAKDDDNHVLHDMLVDSAAGAAVGTGVGLVAQIALVSANISLFVASPVIAPLVMLGWGAGLGGFLGAAVGATKKAKPFSDLVQDAVNSGQHVVVVETASDEEIAIAQNVFKEATGDFQETVK